LVQDRKRKIFYGYIVVGAGFLVSLFIWGSYNTFGIFFKPISSEFVWTRAMTSGAQSLAFFMFGVTSIFAGRLTDRFGPRVVLVSCGLFLGLGFLLMSQVHSLWQFYIFYGLIMGAGMSGAETPVLATIARWFTSKRGMLIGVVKTGASVGILLAPLFANWLISEHGWRMAYIVIGGIAMVGVVSAALFFKRDPTEVGQLPYGAAKTAETELNMDEPQFSLQKIVRMRQFWLLAVAYFLHLFCAQGVVLAHIAPHVTDLGISTTVAASIVGTIGGASIIGRIAMGSLCDRLGNKRTVLISLSLLVVSMVLLLFARQPWMFYLFALLEGLAHGGVFTVIVPLLAELFGLRSLGATFGLVIFVGTIGGGLGPFLAGYIFDVTGSYQPVFLLCLAASIIAITLVSVLRPTSAKRITGNT